jgi:hypothetical protein
MTKRFFLPLLFIGVLFGMTVLTTQPQTVSAHQSGCHRWHSCPSDSGSYVCGDLGYTSGCGGATAAPAPQAQVITLPKPHVPVITTESITEEVPIVFESRIEYTSREYSSFSKVTQEGRDGIKRIVTAVTLTDGTETARTAAAPVVAAAPQPRITLIGNRISPLAKITRFWDAGKKDRYAIKGTFTPNSEVVLAVGTKKIKRVKTDSQGVFLFKNIKITEAKPELIIHERRSGKEHQVSEKTYVDKKTKEIWTEYQVLHKD